MAMRCRVVYSYLTLILLMTALPVEAGSSFGETTWERSRQKLSQLNDWSLGIRRISKGAAPEIIVNGGEIVINGKVVRFGDDISTWKEALGGHPREMSSQDLFIWDELGLKVGLRWDGSGEVLFFKVFFSCRKYQDPDICKGSASHSVENRPKQYFPGYLEFEGGPIDSKSTVVEANRLIRGSANFGRGCGPGFCSIVRSGPGYILSGADTDGNNIESTIYGVSFEGDVFKASRELKIKTSTPSQERKSVEFDEIAKNTLKQTAINFIDWASVLLGLPAKKQTQP